MGAPSLPPTEAALLEAARAGDRAALEALLAREQPRLWRFGIRMCRDVEDARDVMQEALLTAVSRFGSFRGDAALSTWLFKIAHSACAKKHRRAAHPAAARYPLPDDGGVSHPGPLPDEALGAREIRDALEDAIAALEPAQREVLLLRDAEGLAAAEVAEIVGISVEAVKSRLHRARLAVRARLAPLLAGDEPARANTCPDVLETYSRYLEGEVDAQLCRDMQSHVAACARCAAACDSLKRTLALCSAVPQGPVPREVQEALRQAVRQAAAGTR